jgi:hypothetical protein
VVYCQEHPLLLEFIVLLFQPLIFTVNPVQEHLVWEFTPILLNTWRWPAVVAVVADLEQEPPGRVVAEAVLEVYSLVMLV